MPSNRGARIAFTNQPALRGLFHARTPMKITNDPIIKRGTLTGKSKYSELFEALTPENNCIAATSPDESEKLKCLSGALKKFAKKHHPGARIASTKAYATDGLPRVWLVFPEPVKTNIRGNFPKAA